MAFEYRFNVIRFYSKLNRFVLSPRKKPNHFVLKIRPGGFADYTLAYRFVIQFEASVCNGNGEYKDGYGDEQVHSCRCVGVIPCPGYLHVYQREVCDVQRIG